MMRPVEATTAFAAKRPWTVLGLSALLTLLGLWLTVTRFAIDTGTERLISPDLSWRKSEIAFSKAFPGQGDVIVVVIDAANPEAAETAADSLVERLSARRDLFRKVQRPDGGAFFARNGLLYLPRDELKTTLDRLAGEAGLLEPLAADPSLRGFGEVIQTAIAGTHLKLATTDDLGPVFSAFAASIESALAGRPTELSWLALLSSTGTAISGSRAMVPGARKLVLAEPVLDFAALEPGAAAVDAIRDGMRDLGLAGRRNLRVRLTGTVPLADDEFATLAENAGLNTTLTLLALVMILYAALRSPKLIAGVLVTIMAGLAVTSGLGLLLVGSFNLISIAFAVLFVGLGVDFGIQFAVRFRTEQAVGGTQEALRAAARGVGFSLTLAAVSLAIGFLSFLPTDFKGVSELGIIAGLGMLIAFAGSITLLPALIALTRPAPRGIFAPSPKLASIDRWIERHRRLVLIATAVVTVAGLPALFALRFDSDPMNLRSRSVESVATYLELAHDPMTSPDVLNVLLPSGKDVAALSRRIEALPEVSRVVSAESLVPDDQAAKLGLIAAATSRLSGLLRPTVRPSPADAERVEALREAATSLRELEAPAASEGKRTAARLALALDGLAEAPAATRDAASVALLTNFHRLTESVRTALQASPVTGADIPADRLGDWVAPGGQARLAVFPKERISDPAASRRFVAAVEAITPDVTGAPVTIARSGETIVRAFAEAGILAFVAITVILWIALRRLSHVLLALGPLVLAGILTLEAAQLLGLSLNFANIIALPLMFAVGVAFHIYYLIAWRQGVVDVLASSLTRAIFFSALTTGIAFGSLWASSHPGTASMGKLLAISLVFTLVAAFVIVPAFLGPPPSQEKRAKASRASGDTSAASSSA